MKSSLKPLYLGLRGAFLRAMPVRGAGGPVPDASGGTIRRILFIRLDRVGDVVLSTPAIAALKKRFPRAELTVLLRPQTAALLDGNPDVDRRVVLDPGAGLAQRIRILRDLRRSRFDLAVDPSVDWKLEPAAIAWASGAPIRVGYPCGGREAFFTTLAEQANGDFHMTDVILGTLRPVGIEGADRQPRLCLGGQERNRAAAWLARKAAGGRPLVGLHPGAYYETQRWFPEHFAALADGLQGRFDVLLFGGTADAGLVARIQSLMSGSALRAVTADIRWFAALLSHCRLLVCNNSGPLHMASALGVPTVSFMGPTVRALWAPLGERHTVLRADGLSCIGCNRGACPAGTLECMRRITPEMAVEAVEGMVHELHDPCLPDFPIAPETPGGALTVERPALQEK